MQLGIDPTKLSKSLSGTRRFTTYELAAIAECGRTTVDWLLTGTTPELSRVATRVASDTLVSTVDKAVQRATDLAEVDEALRKLLGTEELLSLPDWSPGSTSAVRQGESMGTAVRKTLDEHCLAEMFSQEPELAIERAFDVNVACIPLDGGFDGLAWATPGFRLIVLNSDVRQWTRRRFTLVHELMHIVAGDTRSNGFKTDQDVMRTDRRQEEMRANAAAAAFLMPAEQVIQLASGTHVGKEDFSRLVRQFGVSPSAMAWRLFNLDIIDAVRCGELRLLTLLDTARLGDWLPEYEELSLETRQRDERLPARLATRALRAYLDGVITARIVGKALNVDAEVVRDFFAEKNRGALPFSPGGSVGAYAPADAREAVFEP
jgi:IrrE N-terminal-like domain